MSRSSTFDPLEKFRFLVDLSLPDASKTDGSTKAAVRLGFHDVQMPKRSTNKIMYREGHNPDINSVSAGLTTMEDIVMSRGSIASDGAAANDFYQWIEAIHNPTTGIAGYGAGAPSGATTDAPPANGAGRAAVTYRGELLIKQLDRSGAVVRAWRVYNAIATHYVPGSDLNAGEDGEKSMESLTVAYEDFQEMKVSDLALTTSL